MGADPASVRHPGSSGVSRPTPSTVACTWVAAAPRPVVREGGLRVVVAAVSTARRTEGSRERDAGGGDRGGVAGVPPRPHPARGGGRGDDGDLRRRPRAGGD